MDEGVQPDRIAEGGDHAAGDPELVTQEGLAGVELRLDERPLGEIGGRDVELGMVVAELRDGFMFPLGGNKFVGDLGCPDHADSPVPFEKRTVTAPRWANSARNTSPGCTATIRCTAPGNTTSPALSPTPKVPSLFASHATQRAGFPSAAAPAPVSISW